MFQNEAVAAREKVVSEGMVSMRWNGFSFVPNKAVDRNILTLYGIHTKFYNEQTIDGLLKELGAHGIALETIGYDPK